jgi:glycosyltransferase involved in cell wall biosynthesis
MLSLDDFRQLGIARECRSRGVPYVYVSEYNLRTRQQIVDATTTNPLKRMRRRLWERGQERKRRRALAGAVGLQCNGTPTYEDYKAICSDTLLFFDTRVTAAMLASEGEVWQKYAAWTAGRPLRLLFSGRLVAMKGVMDLISVARELKKLKVDFLLSICGDGDLAGSLEQAIRAHDLGSQVKLEGVLDFANELMPLVKREIDLFVCCHPQGDPSCTYLETMACGVPIAGYANDAFAGLVERSGSGWLAPLNRPDLLAAAIQRAGTSIEPIKEMALRSVRFAAQHTFELEFARRMEQMRLLAERGFPHT